ncbi:interleukin-10 receptor subunit alpha [Eucyclogobius newberryi]|uniref:interleukin-10 receptor subunit alpha n=1 Tax=Eucyclogobius newberryi TaxID=166745 RepID=UPI003B5AD251
MDLSIKTSVLIFMMACVSCVSGQVLPGPENVQVNTSDGEVIVYWDKPADAPLDVLYNVQFGLYKGTWTLVTKCTHITQRFCDLSHLIEDYFGIYKVRVQMEAGGVHSEWKPKKILPNSGDLQPPSFTMWATSSTLTIHMHQKPILKKLFLFGISYTIYLEDKEQNKTTTAYLKDDPLWDNEMTKVFRFLRWGKEYCVSAKVEGQGGGTSRMSPKKCLVLPEKEWIIIAVASLTVVGVLVIAAFIAIFILCYIKSPVKTPVAIKSPVSGWRPLSIVEATMEVVTDKGWFMSSAGTEVNRVFRNLPATFIKEQKSGEEDRRPSTDSGVSMKSSTINAGHDDSGCGSIGVRDAICHYPVQDEGSDTLSTGKSDDSGVGLSCHSDASSLSLEDQDSGCLNKSGEYHNRRQLNTHDCDNDDIFKEKCQEQQLIDAMPGYRTNTSVCTCSGANLCIWCRSQDNYRGQCKGLHQNDNMVESHRHYYPKDPMDRTETQLTLVQMEETFPMLTSLSSFPLMEKGTDFNMNDVSISLCDVEINHH